MAHGNIISIIGRKQRGFNLIELAIVLGLIGLVAGGIWMAAAAAGRSHDVNRTVDQVQQIVESIRDAHAASSVLPNSAYTAFTQAMAQKDVFPAETKLDATRDPATCAVGNPCYFAHPWSTDGAGSICGGGTICVSVQDNFGGVTQRYAIMVLLRNLPRDVCIAQGTKFSAVMDQVGLAALGVRTGVDNAQPATIYNTAAMPPSPTQLVAACSAASNHLYLAFRLNPS